ncbi:hypothetical protein [Hoeflea olei]|nr:hypothetical protein [Hoeflea olei]
MSFQFSPSRLLSTSVMAIGLASVSLPAWALDADDFATKVAALATRGGAKLSFSAVEPDGSTVVLKSVRIEVPDAKPLAIGDVTFEGVEEEDDGSYYVEQALFPSVDMEKDGARLTVDDIAMTGLTVPAEPVSDETSLDGLSLAYGMSTGPIKVVKDGKQLFSMSGIEQTTERADDGSSLAVDFEGSDIMIDLSMVENPKVKDALSSMGYTSLHGDLKLKGTWDIEPGILDLSEYSLALDDVGRLAMSFQISGYTLDLVKALQQAQAAAAANPDPQAAQQAMGLASLGLMQQLNFVSAKITFEDDSVTEKALAYAGKQQGMSGEQMGMAFKGMLPLMLGQLGIPALQQQVSAAASTYLDNPGNITITAKPANPVAVPVLMGAGMGGDPKTLVDLLNVQVTANQPN